MSEAPLVIGKNNKKYKVAKTGSEINAARRQNADSEKRPSGKQNKARQGTDHQRLAKIDRENEVSPPSKVPLAVGQAMQAARQGLGLTQKEIAQKINEKPSVIQDYESGKAIPNGQVLIHLERQLHVKLRGSGIGESLTVKKSKTEKKAKAEPVEAEVEPVEAEVEPVEAEVEPVEAEVEPVEVEVDASGSGI